MYTFRISRPAIMLPCVERRSPAMRTPPGYLSATMVVPWGSAPPPPPPPGGPPPLRIAGNNSGACRRRRSANEDWFTAEVPENAELEGRRSGNGQVTVRPFGRTHGQSPLRFPRGRHQSRRADRRSPRRAFRGALGPRL